MAAGVLPESNVAIDLWRFDGWKFGCAEILLAEELIHGPGADSAQKHAFGVDPATFHLLRTAADENGPRCAESDELMSIHRQIVRSQRTSILEEVSGHPMISTAGGEILDLFAEFAAKNLGPAFARGANEADGETGFVGHGNQSGFSVARKPFDTDLLGVNGFVRFKIIECATGGPGPSAQRAPIVDLARLALVHKADDALRQALAVIGLDAGGNEDGIAPSFGNQLLLPRRTTTCKSCPLRFGESLSDRGQSFLT